MGRGLDCLYEFMNLHSLPETVRLDETLKVTAAEMGHCWEKSWP